MTSLIVYKSEPVTLLGGGDATLTDVAEATALAPTCVAADGGANLAVRAGVIPDAVIGDFDSVTPETLAALSGTQRVRIREQDSTDFEKALCSISTPVVLAVGFLGARMDHSLAALHVLTAHPDRACILIGGEEILFLCPPQIEIPTQAGDVVSLFPLGMVSGTSRGLQWDIEGLIFEPMSQIGTSNAALGPVSLTMDRAAMIVIAPRAYLASVTQALVSAPQSARWPVRAGRYTVPPQS